MSAYPVVLEGTGLIALVVGGGAVATRKVMALLDSGATVRVVAPEISDALADADGRYERLHIIRERYDARYIENALIIGAATKTIRQRLEQSLPPTRGRLVNVVTAPDSGNFVTPATHRAGQIVVAVSAGGVPGAAVRIRDRIAEGIDRRYESAVDRLAILRRELLDAGDRERWADAAATLIGSQFCDEVESGRFDAKGGEWR